MYEPVFQPKCSKYSLNLQPAIFESFPFLKRVQEPPYIISMMHLCSQIKEEAQPHYLAMDRLYYIHPLQVL